MMKKVIFHVDVNSAFLSWEAVFRLKYLGAKVDLREIPSAIGGDMSKRHGIILAKSTPAKKYNIKTGEPVSDALKKCKDLYLAPPNYNLYEKCSKAFMEILREYTPIVEQYSIDEAFMDLSSVIGEDGDPVKLANDIRERIYRELGFTVNIGVSDVKLLAKMASDFKKPNRVHTLFKKEIQKKMCPLPVSDLFFVGRATTKKLYNLGITTIGQLATSDINILRYHLKKQGEIVYNFANGIDDSDVIKEPPKNKGYGNSTTIAFDVEDAQTAKKVILGLCETVGRRLRQDNVKAQVISVGIKSFDLKYASHQLTIPNATNTTNEIYKYACQVFDELWDGTPIRHIGVQTSHVKEADECVSQMELFDNNNYEKWEKVDKTMDELREKFGIDVVKRATFVESPIDHMSGGISREKRTVDYSKIDIE